MRSVAALALWTSLAALAVTGCKRSQPTPATATAAAPTPPPGAPGPASPSVAIGADGKARTVPAVAGHLDCEKLLGAARASAALGHQVVALANGTGVDCHYDGASLGDPVAVIDVLVGCKEAAMPIARNVLSKLSAGARELSVGVHGIAADERGPGVIQFLDRGSPCAAEVHAVPTDKALEVAREVARGLAAGARP